jgi:hypothetical protein
LGSKTDSQEIDEITRKLQKTGADRLVKELLNSVKDYPELADSARLSQAVTQLYWASKKVTPSMIINNRELELVTTTVEAKANAQIESEYKRNHSSETRGSPIPRIIPLEIKSLMSQQVTVLAKELVEFMKQNFPKDHPIDNTVQRAFWEKKGVKDSYYSRFERFKRRVEAVARRIIEEENQPFLSELLNGKSGKELVAELWDYVEKNPPPTDTSRCANILQSTIKRFWSEKYPEILTNSESRAHDIKYSIDEAVTRKAIKWLFFNWMKTAKVRQPKQAYFRGFPKNNGFYMKVWEIDALFDEVQQEFDETN